MKFFATIAVLFLLFPSNTYAARCKVNGEWYSYDSPKCNPHKSDGAEESDPIQQDSEPPPQEKPATPSYRYQGVVGLLRPWDVVSLQAKKRCKDKQYSMNVYFVAGSCLMAEEIGYWAMHGNFDMPEKIAPKAKALCIAKTESFASQSRCMQNESKGYASFVNDFEMPIQSLKKARAKCSEQYESYSIKGSCMRRAAA